MKDWVLRLGDPRLRVVSAPVTDPAEPLFRAEMGRLREALRAFRAAHGFGRGIAAPQIGVARRLVVVNLGAGEIPLINPVIVWRSPETFTLWDDCMCFPELLVRVRRHASLTITFADEQGRAQSWEKLGRAESELLQHEIDHLDGILAVDRALDAHGIVYRSVFAADPGYFRAQVDDPLQATV